MKTLIISRTATVFAFEDICQYANFKFKQLASSYEIYCGERLNKAILECRTIKLVGNVAWLKRTTSAKRNGQRGKEYTLLAELFRPNIGRPPLPPVFLVDLRVPLSPKADSGRAVAATSVPFSQPPLEKLMVAIAQPPISSSEISDARIRYRDDKTREITSEWSVLAIKTAAAKGAKLIIFPELFMPDGALDTVRENAKKVGIGVVCGVEGVWVDSKYSNFANIVIPDVPYDHKQFKKFPSNYEPQNFQTKGGQLCFLQSSIGSFSVVLCSDPPLLVVQLAV